MEIAKAEEIMESTANMNDKIRQIVMEKFPLAKKRGLKDSDELLESGVIDSLGILDLVNVLETDFGLTIRDEDLLPENFRSIDHIVEFAKQKSSS
jgi:acyl carrier protein